jgi:hypothetical protein
MRISVAFSRPVSPVTRGVSVSAVLSTSSAVTSSQLSISSVTAGPRMNELPSEAEPLKLPLMLPRRRWRGLSDVKSVMEPYEPTMLPWRWGTGRGTARGEVMGIGRGEDVGTTRGDGMGTARGEAAGGSWRDGRRRCDCVRVRFDGDSILCGGGVRDGREGV